MVMIWLISGLNPDKAKDVFTNKESNMLDSKKLEKFFKRKGFYDVKTKTNFLGKQLSLLYDFKFDNETEAIIITTEHISDMQLGKYITISYHSCYFWDGEYIITPDGHFQEQEEIFWRQKTIVNCKKRKKVDIN